MAQFVPERWQIVCTASRVAWGSRVVPPGGEAGVERGAACACGGAGRGAAGRGSPPLWPHCSMRGEKPDGTCGALVRRPNPPVRTPNVDADGVYDVHGRGTGEIRAVGAVRRTNGVVGWLDGAIWVRTP